MHEKVSGAGVEDYRMDDSGTRRQVKVLDFYALGSIGNDQCRNRAVDGSAAPVGARGKVVLR